MTKTTAAALLLLGLSPLAGAYTFPKVKPANLPLYDEALPCAYGESDGARQASRRSTAERRREVLSMVCCSGGA